MISVRLYLAGLLALLANLPSYGQCADSLQLLGADSLRMLVYRLANDSMAGRLSGSEGWQKATRWLEKEFQRNGLATVTADSSFESRFSLPVLDGHNSSRTAVSLLGALPGRSRPNEWVILCAHYDHVGTESTNPYASSFTPGMTDKSDTIYNGANDNASGTAALVSLMRYFTHCGPRERTLLFVAFSGEELGLLGSASLASKIPPEKLVAVINLEMLGRTGDRQNGNRPYIPGAGYSNLRLLLNDQLRKTDQKKYGRHFFQTDPYTSESLFTRSDNYSFAKYGVPAHTIMLGSPNDPTYHSVKDEPGSLNYSRMAELVQAIAISIQGILNGSVTPARLHF